HASPRDVKRKVTTCHSFAGALRRMPAAACALRKDFLKWRRKSRLVQKDIPYIDPQRCRVPKGGGAVQPGDRREALLLHAAVVTPFDLIQDGALHVVDGRIAAIGSAAELAALRERVAVVYDLTGCWCLPGFIDVHVHGGGGADAMEA